MATCVATETLPDSEMSDDCVWPLGHSWLSDGAPGRPGRPGHTVSASLVSWTPLSASHSDTVVTAADNPSSSPLSWININNSLRIITHKCVQYLTAVAAVLQRSLSLTPHAWSPLCAAEGGEPPAVPAVESYKTGEVMTNNNKVHDQG